MSTNDFCPTWVRNFDTETDPIEGIIAGLNDLIH